MFTFYVDGVLLHDGAGDTVISDWTVKKSRDDIDSVTFRIYKNNPRFSYFTHPLSDYVEVKDGSTQVFYGRVCGVGYNMDEKGLIYKEITCEGCKAFMLDTAIVLDNFAKIPVSKDFSNITGQVDAIRQKYDLYSDGTLDNRENTSWKRFLTPTVNPLMDDNTYAVKAIDLVQVAIAQHNMQCEDFSETNKQVELVASGSWQNVTIYKAVEYDTTTLDFINAVIKNAGAEAFASYDTTNEHVILTIRDADYSSISGNIQLADNMISCVQTEVPEELVTCVSVYIDVFSQDKSTSDNVPWTREFRDDIGTVMTSLNKADTGSYTSGKGYTWFNEVVSEFTNKPYKYGVNHAYTRGGNGCIIEDNGWGEYGAVNANLVISGLVNLQEVDGWEDSVVLPSDPTNNLNQVNLTNALVTEDIFKRIVRLAIEYLNSHCRIIPSVEIGVADMHLINVNYSKLNVGSWWNVKNSLLGLNDTLEIVEITYNQESPHIPSVTLGRKPTRSVDTSTHFRKPADDTNKKTSADNYSKDRGTTTGNSDDSSDWRYVMTGKVPHSMNKKTIYLVTGE